MTTTSGIPTQTILRIDNSSGVETEAWPDPATHSAEECRTLGITGSRYGWTDAQAQAFRDLLPAFGNVRTFVHGGCTGVDVEALRVVVRALPKLDTVHCWPAKVDPRWDGHPEHVGVVVQHFHAKMPPLVRNRQIVRMADFMVAMPEFRTPEIGGTWRTIRYADQTKVPCLVILPNGSLRERPE